MASAVCLKMTARQRVFSSLLPTRGSAIGQANLGAPYANGRGGLPKDDGEAARLFKLAADQGDPTG